LFTTVRFYFLTAEYRRLAPRRRTPHAMINKGMFMLQYYFLLIKK